MPSAASLASRRASPMAASSLSPDDTRIKSLVYLTHNSDAADYHSGRQGIRARSRVSHAGYMRMDADCNEASVRSPALVMQVRMCTLRSRRRRRGPCRPLPWRQHRPAKLVTSCRLLRMPADVTTFIRRATSAVCAGRLCISRGCIDVG
jgi:hypothetical protein